MAPDDLEPDTLRAVIESFVLREGTDYGVHETSLEDKVAQVLIQLRRGEAHITFDPASESVNVVVTSAIGDPGGPSIGRATTDDCIREPSGHPLTQRTETAICFWPWVSLPPLCDRGVCFRAF